jgi:hypothetical protein
MPDVGRNDPCPCGSGKKYKKCCEAKTQLQEHNVLEKKWQEAEKAAVKQRKAEGETPENAPASPGNFQKKNAAGKGAVPKHSTFVAPKASMQRRTGGG